MSETQGHWDRVYDSKAVTEVSWFQPSPEVSVRLIQRFAASRADRIIDVGCGAGTLLAALAADGFENLTGLDVSAVAVDKAKAALGAASESINWIVADIVRWTPEARWDLWHDRAVFHFLTESNDQRAYLDAVESALSPGAIAVMATFALDGPERCSGLPVQRYSGATLAERFGQGFRLLAQEAESHVTPKGVTQKFMYAVFERV